MKILKQLAKEFWIPLVLSILWVAYNVFGNGASDKWTIPKALNVFGPTFFLLSWLAGQFFRVKKQTKVEDSFGAMEARFNELLNKVEQSTHQMIGHISGGDSFVFFQIGSLDNKTNTGCLTAIHQGEHPLYEVVARIVDIHKFASVKRNLALASTRSDETIIDIGNLIPSHAKPIRQWKIENEPEQLYNIFYTARNGNFVQSLSLKKINGIWVSASRVRDKDNNILYEQVDEDYPKNSEGKVGWEAVYQSVLSAT